jgi:Delta-aminolevulinic acid dehydratase
MPGVAQTSPDELLKDATAAAEVGVGGIILFGIPTPRMPQAPRVGRKTVRFSRPSGC